MNGGDNHFEDVKHKPQLTPNSPNPMFTSKLHPHTLSPLHLHQHHPLHHHHQQQQQQQLHPHHHQQHQELLSRECHNNSEEEESRSSGGAVGGAVVEYGQSTGGSGGGRLVGPASKKPKTAQTQSGGGGNSGGGGDGASIEVARRPRGRPPGSKNKPKPPIIITRDNESSMRPHLLHVPSGKDVIESVARFARSRNLGLSVLSATGYVANVTLRQPSNATVTFHGRFEILSAAFTYVPPSQAYAASFGFVVYLAGPQGQVFGGSVHGALVAATDVCVVATTFTSPIYVRLPEDEQVSNTSEDPDSQVEPPQSSAVESHSAPAESGAMTMYHHLPGDVIWTPTARPPSQQHF